VAVAAVELDSLAQQELAEQVVAVTVAIVQALQQREQQTQAAAAVELVMVLLQDKQVVLELPFSNILQQEQSLLAVV
jgi:hypothetical protein